ncbi:MAG TPA: hypothetical protein VNO23_03955 [Candidatus Binatia bacterium]|nr:hypothetical protein [Candidatus Binatia bacterium]
MRARSRIVGLLVLAAVAVVRPTSAQVPAAPQWREPGQYRVEVVMRQGSNAVVLRRFVDSGRARTEMRADGHEITIIERPDRGVAYLVMPPLGQPQDRMYLERKLPASDPTGRRPAPAVAMRYLGSEMLGGRRCDKYEVSAEGRTALYWVDGESGAPVRMQDGDLSVDWRDYRPDPQPAELFEPPAGYQRVVMPEIEGLMGQMAAQTALGMAGGFATQAAGQALAAAGAAVGGPIGAVVGQMVGERVAGWLLGQAQNALTPGPAPRR